MNESVLTSIINAIPGSALPLVVCVLGIGYLYFKFNRVEKDRESTKELRDKDSQEMHDTLLKHEFRITELKDIVNLHRDKLNSIDSQLSIINSELVKLNVQVESLTNTLKEQNQIMRDLGQWKN